MNKFGIISIFLFPFTISSYGQVQYNIRLSVAEDKTNNEKILNEEGVELPTYNGGIEQVEQYLNANLEYGKKDYKTGLFGKNYFQLRIGRDGKLIEASCIKATVPIQTITKINKLLRRCNEWMPATKNGNPLETIFWITITFDSSI
jgi:hypothetical protein